MKLMVIIRVKYPNDYSLNRLIVVSEIEFKNVSKSIELGFCSFCGACLSICPFNNLTYSPDTPSTPKVGPSTYCDRCKLTLCMQVCPQLRIPEELYDLSEKIKPIAIYVARSKDKSILERAQDGGAVTSILVACLRSKVIDSAIVVKRDNKWKPLPILTSSQDEIIEASGTKYVYVPSLMKLREALTKKEVNSIAVVGVPCQIRALEKMKEMKLRHANKVKLGIGLFCTHNFTWECIQKIFNELGLSPGDVVRMDIKAKLIFTTKDGKSYEYPLDKASQNLRPACRQCPEFISMHADINVGSIGSPKGWSTVIVMTSQGEKALNEAVNQGLLEVKPIEEKKLKLLMKFIKRKAEEAKKHRIEYVNKYGKLLTGPYIKK